jgi:hypothetical protein
MLAIPAPAGESASRAQSTEPKIEAIPFQFLDDRIVFDVPPDLFDEWWLIGRLRGCARGTLVGR